MTRPLGCIQRGVLESLAEHGYWYHGCGWLWRTHGGTETTMISLKRRGLAKIRYSATGTTIFEITEAGREELKKK